MNKTVLVALREYLENLRTKTFWIGILAVPVILIGTIAIMVVMRDAKDARRYGVVDHSEGQWLSKAIEDRANESDFKRLLDEVIDAASLEGDRDEVLALMRQKQEEMAGPEVQRELFGLVIDAVAQADPAAPPDMEELQSMLLEQLTQWMASKTPEEIAQLDTNLDRERYIRVYEDGDPDAIEDELKQQLQDGSLFAYFVIPEDPVGSDDDSRYVSNNLTDSELRRWFSNHATEIVRARRIESLSLSKEQAASIRNRFEFSAKKVSAETGEIEEVKKEEQAHQFAPVVFVYLLWISIMMVTQMLLTNTIEEKSNRIIEVLLSSVSPFQLMAGKIFGIAATGLTLVVFWALCAVVAVEVAPHFAPGIAGLQLELIIGDPRYLGSFIGYFLGGYFFFAAILVGIGAVCNSLKEAQNLQQPVFVLLIVPIAAMVPVVNDPNGTLAKVLTYIPPFTPFLMMNRAAGPPPAWEYAATTALILVSIVIAFWGAAKVFRIGILMTGKRPSVREIFSWLRAPVGAVAVRRDP